jgi:hypothetical protein
LSPAGQAILLRDRPGALGSMDGLPAEARDKANRAVFEQQRADLQRQRDEIQHRLDGLKESDPSDMDEYHDLEDQRGKLDGRPQGMDAISERLNHPLPGQPPAFLLGINPDNAGQVIITSGNPDHAQNVATYVPGTTAGLTDIDTDLNRAEVMGQARCGFAKVTSLPSSVLSTDPVFSLAMAAFKSAISGSYLAGSGNLENGSNIAPMNA